jgi:hypothetical protein
LNEAKGLVDSNFHFKGVLAVSIILQWLQGFLRHSLGLRVWNSVHSCIHNFPDEERIGKSLDAYLAKTTSEDNAAFEEILQENAIAHQAKHAWLYEQEIEKEKVC